ncbi:NAD(P)H-binding protein [Amycolatopsis sp. CA-128772]|uniref:NAD(P)H-binding protein n=1 Tax=Amycolatopsis sp. CA-128772 TaxID=2073159 RepID=UPI001E35B739|nr:NAD(P)H-binding protein [Amycolatopsis sp. CA-128772]
MPADRVVAAVRTPEKAAGLAARGVEVRRADYTDPESLVTAFKGAEKVLLVSGGEVGQRVARHQAVIEAAGLPATILRNNWYNENYAETIMQAAATGSFVGSAGDVTWSNADLAAEIAEAAGREVGYVDLPADEHAKALTGAGLPEPVVGMLVAIDADIRDGLLAETTGNLRTRTGRPGTPIGVTVAEIAG